MNKYDTAKTVGIENALELLLEEYDDASKLAKLTNSDDTRDQINLYMDGLKNAIEIVTINLPTK